MSKNLKNKIILVTGGTGSIGSELVEQILRHQPKQVRVLSTDESKQYDLMERLGNPENLRMLIGDVRDRERLDLAFKDVDIVIHAAALKHVPFCEYNSNEAVKTNIFGSQNVIAAALKNNVKKVIAISTDKAVNPNNVMGTTKLMMEKLFINANYGHGAPVTRFSCVRFGNVAWARGSVLPLWKKQAERNGSINITDGNMTRFLMSIKDACSLVLEAVDLSDGREIFILKMPSVKMKDLARMFLDKYYPGKKIAINSIGSRIGEKMHEELISEAGDAVVFADDRMFIVLPKVDIYGLAKKKNKDYPGFKELDEKRARALSHSSEKAVDNRKISELI